MARRASLLVLAWLLGGCTDSGAVLGPARAGASAVSAGMVHACAIIDGAGYCWGENADGQLGTGDTEPRNRPTPIAGLPQIERLCTGEAHTCAIDADGAVWCWGGNARGQLGRGTRDPALVPEPVDLTTAARAISCSFNHTCAVLDDDTLQCWGQNREGELGQSDTYPGDGSLEADALTPVTVPGRWRNADAGQGHSCAIAADGGLWCWGRNSFFELGTGTENQIRTPVAVGDAIDWEAVDAGQSHTCGLRRDGSVWCWGRNTASDDDEGFPLGIEGPLIVPEPTVVPGTSGTAQLATAIFHTCSIDRSSVMSCWGRNIEGQLGLGEAPLFRSATAVSGSFHAVATGGFFTCAIGLDGWIACAGENRNGQLGTADNQRRNAFTALAAP